MRHSTKTVCLKNIDRDTIIAALAYYEATQYLLPAITERCKELRTVLRNADVDVHTIDTDKLR